MTAAVQNETQSHMPATDDEIESLRAEVEMLDGMILSAVVRRNEVSQLIGRAQLATGRTRASLSREMDVLHRFAELGQEGHSIAMALLRLGRGRTGTSAGHVGEYANSRNRAV